MAQEDDAAEVVSVVSSEAFQLVADGHDAIGFSDARTGDEDFQAGVVAGDGGSVLGSGEETVTEAGPGFRGVCGESL